MKSLRQKMLAMAAVVAVSGLMMASVAQATDKLIVKHSSGADGYKVDDASKVTQFATDAGTSDELEYARYERSSSGTPAVGFGVKRSQLLKLGAASVVAQEQVLKWSGLGAGVEQSDFIIRNYASGTLRDAFVVSAQPFFYRYLKANTYTTPQAAGSFILKKGAGTMSNGTGPRVAFKADDNTGTELVVGALAFPVDYTNSRSSVVFQVKGSSTDAFADTEALRVTYDGKLALGTTTPTSKLHVVGLPGPYDTVAAAQSQGGLTSGAIFRTSSNTLMIVP